MFGGRSAGGVEPSAPSPPALPSGGGLSEPPRQAFQPLRLQRVAAVLHHLGEVFQDCGALCRRGELRQLERLAIGRLGLLEPAALPPHLRQAPGHLRPQRRRGAARRREGLAEQQRRLLEASLLADDVGQRTEDEDTPLRPSPASSPSDWGPENLDEQGTMPYPYVRIWR